MNKTQFTVKVEELISNLQKPLLDEALRLYESGGVDTQKYGDDFELPKICLTVALSNMSQEILAPTVQAIREARNLESF